MWFSVTTAIYTVLFFIFSGSLNLIKSDFKGLTKNGAIKEFYTIDNFGVLFLILATSIVGGIYFMNKNDQLQARLKDKKDRIIYFKESLVFLVVPIIGASIVNFFLKLILFGFNMQTLMGQFEIPFHVIFNVSIYVFIIGLLGVSLSFLFQITTKSVLTAALYPLIMLESFILVFGVSNLFVSDRIPVIKVISDFISGLVLNYLNMFLKGLRVEMLGFFTFFMTILGYLALTGVCLASSSRFLATYKEKTLTHSYRSSFLRRTMLFMFITLVTTYFSLAIFGSYSLLKNNSITLDKAFEYVEIISVIVIPFMTVLIEYLYMKKNNLIVKKEVDKKEKNKKVKLGKNKKNKSKNIELKENEVSLENKGIMKETIEITYAPEFEEELSNIEEELEYVIYDKEIEFDENEVKDAFFDEDIETSKSIEEENEFFIKEDNK